MKKSIYLDYAAATPIDSRVLASMQPYFSELFYNPSATYLAAKSVSHALENARAEVAGILGSRPGEIIFTAGATEANNIVISGVASKFLGAELLVSSIEHDSVLSPAESFGAKKIPVSTKGLVDQNALKNMITEKTVLVSVMLVNNELGTIQPLSEIALMLKDIKSDRIKSGNKLPLYLHTDAAQAGNFLDLKVSRLGVDLMSINGGKIYGPKQSGVLFIKSGTSLRPLILGGGQEFGMRSGTENVAGAIGFAAALQIAQKQRACEVKKLSELKNTFANKLQKNIPSSVINGHLKHSTPHLLNVTFPGLDNERLMMELDEAGIQVATGSACSASSDQPSHVLSAIGLSDEQAQSSIRFSMGRDTTSQDIDKTVDLLTIISYRHR